MTAETKTETRGFDNGSGLTLNVGIVGAGIAGLAAAAALSRLGHHVDVYERSRFANEVGAAINVGPNAGPVLRALGFDVAGAKLMEVQEGVQFNAHTMEETYRGRYDDFATRFNSPWYFSHRVDLHSELKRLALGSSGKFTGANFNLSTAVVDVDCDSGVLKLEDGTTVTKDLIVGADGVHSILAQSVLGAEVPANEIGECAYRFLIPTAKLLENQITKPLFSEKSVALNIAAVSDRRLVWYPCRNGELQNFVGIHPAKAGREEAEDWHGNCSIQDLLDTFAGFHPDLVEICRNAEDLKLWKLVYRPPIRQWTKGKVILIGDAAHPMLPHQGQGGNQAIEDAGALGVFLSNVQRLEDIPSRLEMVQNIRRNRASAMQIFSNAGQDQSSHIEKEAHKYVQGPIPKNQAEFHQWNFSYNILSECWKVLAES